MKLEDINVTDKEILQDMLSSLELQLTWPYTEEEKAELAQKKEEIIQLLKKYDEEN